MYVFKICDDAFKVGVLMFEHGVHFLQVSDNIQAEEEETITVERDLAEHGALKYENIWHLYFLILFIFIAFF